MVDRLLRPGLIFNPKTQLAGRRRSAFPWRTAPSRGYPLEPTKPAS